MTKVGAVLIAGPTASGKSAVAARVAAELGGTVVNADSMQVYADLRVLTARPSAAEEAAVPHRLFGTVDGAVNHSVGRWAADAAAILASLRAEGRVPVVTGGTGLYFKALTEGLSELPAVPDDVRARVRADAEGRESPALHADLARRDPATAASLRPSDRQRILRALEIHAATGSSLLAVRGERVPGPLAGVPVVAVFLDVDRTLLRARIDRRFEAMMAAGALDEVRALRARGLPPDLPVMRAHGVPGLVDHLAGRATLAEAVARGQADTRAYGKRQVTWFRHQMPDFAAVPPETAREVILRAADRTKCDQTVKGA